MLIVNTNNEINVQYNTNSVHGRNNWLYTTPVKNQAMYNSDHIFYIYV